jgi:DNA-binding CsgD family transcriptional regulator
LTLRLLFGQLTGQQALLVFQERRPSALETLSSGLGLTAREEEVLREATRGLSSAEIADTLVISRRTVEKHLENIYGKLGVDSRGAAVARALFSGEQMPL